MSKEEKDRFLKLYELAINEEHYFLDSYHSHIHIYTGFISAIFGATIIGLFQSSEWYHFTILSFGPILIFIISTIAIGGGFRFYQRFLEGVTFRAKIEQRLGLTEKGSKEKSESELYWKTEPLIPSRHIDSRETSVSSEEFIKKYLTEGYHLWTKRLFHVFQVLGILMLMAIILMIFWIL